MYEIRSDTNETLYRLEVKDHVTSATFTALRELSEGQSIRIVKMPENSPAAPARLPLLEALHEATRERLDRCNRLADSDRLYAALDALKPKEEPCTNPCCDGGIVIVSSNNEIASCKICEVFASDTLAAMHVRKMLADAQAQREVTDA